MIDMRGRDEIEYYAYITFCMVNYKAYIGVTKKPIKTGYVGSGVAFSKALKKYGKAFFVRHDIASGTKPEMEAKERELIEHYGATNSNDFYNIRHGGYNGGHSEQTRLKLRASLSLAMKKPSTKAKLRAVAAKNFPNNLAFIETSHRDKRGKLNPMHGKNHSAQTKLKISKLKIGKKLSLSEEQRSLRTINIRENPVMMGAKSPEQKAKNRWSALKKSFSKDPIVSDDMRMMHDFFGTRKAVANLEPEHLVEFLKFRFKFLQEELNEGNLGIKLGDAEGICDSLVDLVVVAVGTLDLLDIDFKKAWYAVLEANMSKEIGIKPSRPNPLGLPDLIKPDGWKAPSHEGNHGILRDLYPEPVNTEHLNDLVKGN